MSNEKAAKSSMYNLGGKGWLIAVYSFILYFGSSVITATVPIASPMLAETRGWDYGAIMNLNSIGGWLSIPITLGFAQIVKMKGMRWPTVLWVALYGITMITCGSGVWGIYIVSLLAINIFSNGLNLISPPALVANWFPRKKGIVLGIVTIGMPLSTVIALPVFSSIAMKSGISAAYAFWGVFICVIAVLTIFVRNTPQELGCHPDNDPNYKDAIVEENHVTYTLKQYVKQANFWKIIFGYALPFMALVAFMSCATSVLTEKGLEMSTAVSTMTIGGIIGVVGSFIVGFIDQKVGTKSASLLNAAGLAIGLLVIILGHGIAAIIGTYVFFFFVGGLPNVMVSMTIQVYGPREYNSVNRFVSPLILMIRTSCFMIVGLVYGAFGNYTAVCIVFAIIIAVGLIILLTLPKDSRKEKSINE